MKNMLALAASLVLCATLAAPETAMARPKAVPLFEPGQAPSRPMEVLTEMTLEVSSAASRDAAVEQLRQHARKLGADAVVDVVVVDAKKDLPGAQLAAVPIVLLGSLVSIMAMSPIPLENTVAVTKGRAMKHTVRVVRGVAVKYVR